MTTGTRTRIDSIDLLKGLVMVIMALDHTRDYFHVSAFTFSPTDPEHTTWAIYFTRWITHYCAPIFSFLAGVSAFMVGRRMATAELSSFLLKRGLWLAFIELTVVNFSWFFDIHFSIPALLVIWALGISMITLGALVWLPRTAIWIFSLVIIFGHNLLDHIHYPGSISWSVLHEFGRFPMGDDRILFVGYPLVPWVAVMALGYCFGSLYGALCGSARRKSLFNIIGISAIVIFVAVRYVNVYGDPRPWMHFPTHAQSLMSFLNPNKYPPSLCYLLMTLGPALIFLANSEKMKGPIVDFFCTFGRVPFFYYIIHIYLIHFLALIAAQLSRFGWRAMILHSWITEAPALKGYGFPLWVVYAVWIGVVLFLYPFCKRFADYKMAHKEKWWLSYL